VVISLRAFKPKIRSLLLYVSSGSCITFYPSNTQFISFTTSHLGYVFRCKNAFLRPSLLFAAVPFPCYSNSPLVVYAFTLRTIIPINNATIACYVMLIIISLVTHCPSTYRSGMSCRSTLDYILHINDHSIHRPVTNS
jgi:hypothetical protein